jgi:uncharacterized protein (TIGR02453 family)
MGAGIWHPDGETLGRIRGAIVDDPRAWKRAVEGARFAKRFTLSGDVLTRPPRGYDPGHPRIEDLKRKDFIAVCSLTEATVTGPGFLKEFTGLCKEGSPLVKFLCRAVGVPF